MSILVGVVTIVEAMFLDLLVLEVGRRQAETHWRSLRWSTGPGAVK